MICTKALNYYANIIALNYYIITVQLYISGTSTCPFGCILYCLLQRCTLQVAKLDGKRKPTIAQMSHALTTEQFRFGNRSVLEILTTTSFLCVHVTVDGGKHCMSDHPSSTIAVRATPPSDVLWRVNRDICELHYLQLRCFF